MKTNVLMTAISMLFSLNFSIASNTSEEGFLIGSTVIVEGFLEETTYEITTSIPSENGYAIEEFTFQITKPDGTVIFNVTTTDLIIRIPREINFNGEYQVNLDHPDFTFLETISI